MAIRKPAPPRHGRREPDDWFALVSRRISVEEFLALDDVEQTDLEYIDGLVVGKAVPDRNHRNIVGQFDGHFVLYQRSRGGEYGPEARVRVGPNRYRKPDTAYWAAGVDASDDT